MKLQILVQVCPNGDGNLSKPHANIGMAVDQ